MRTRSLLSIVDCGSPLPFATPGSPSPLKSAASERKIIDGTAILSLPLSFTRRMSMGIVPSTLLVIPSESVTVKT